MLGTLKRLAFAVWKIEDCPSGRLYWRKTITRLLLAVRFEL